MDFFSDIFVLYQLSQSTDTAWFSFTLFTMVCPYYTVYSSLMTFKINDIRKIKEDVQVFGVLRNLFLISPLMLVFVTIVDIIFMFINCLAYCILFLIIIFPFGKRFCIAYEQFWDSVFKKFFGMSVMDVRGFKC